MTERSLEELIDASHAFCDAVDQIERLTTEVASKDKKIEFLKEQLNQLANFNPDWDMLEAAQGSLRDHMKIIERLTAEVSRLVAAAQEVFDGRDHDTGSSGQVFVDHGSLMALQAAVNAVSGKRDDLDPVSAKALYDNLDELALDDSSLKPRTLPVDEAMSHPSLERGQVWCRTCRHTKKVDSAECLQSGWPKCCGYTMTIDHPDTWDTFEKGETE